MVDGSLTILARRCRLGEEESIPLLTSSLMTVSLKYRHWKIDLNKHVSRINQAARSTENIDWKPPKARLGCI
jgi:hypothetical protein